jgi:adenylate cyclase
MNNPAQILVVDDEHGYRAMLERQLRASGYAVLQAGDGIEAIAVAREQRPDLILLDLSMPKLDGLEACRLLRSDDSLPRTPIILITGKTDPEDLIAGLDAGADEYLTKPIDPAALVARVRSALQLKALHDQIAEQKADLASWERTLARRVAEQVTAIERIAPLLMGACIQAATTIVVARSMHTAGEVEKTIAERAYKIYETAVGRFGLSGQPGKLH